MTARSSSPESAPDDFSLVLRGPLFRLNLLLPLVPLLLTIISLEELFKQLLRIVL